MPLGHPPIQTGENLVITFLAGTVSGAGQVGDFRLAGAVING